MGRQLDGLCLIISGGCLKFKSHPEACLEVHLSRHMFLMLHQLQGWTGLVGLPGLPLEMFQQCWILPGPTPCKVT